MEWITRIISYIFSFAAGYFFYKIECCFLTSKKGKLLFLLTWVLLSAAVTLVIFPRDPVNITVALVSLLLANGLFFKGKWIVKFSAVTVLYPIAMSLNNLHMDMGVHLYHLLLPGKSDEESDIYASLSYGLVVLFWYLFYRLQKNSLQKIYQILDARAWLMVNIICAASFVSVLSCTYFAPTPTYFIWPALAACIVTNVGSVRLAASYLADGIYADMERRNLQLQQNYYRELEANQKQIRKLRHDLNNHLMVVGRLFEEGKRAEAQKYFEQLSGRALSSSRTFCKNSVVNAVLNSKYNRMAEAEIDSFFHISIDKMMMIDDVSLCTIFANTLDNAVEACQKIEDKAARRISVKARYTENGYFSYEIVNSKCNRIRMRRERFITDKADSASHGVGISSVKEIVERYGGTMDISFTEGEFKVIILIG